MHRALSNNIKPKIFLTLDSTTNPIKGVAMGSPMSSIMAEIFLQYYKNLLIKLWLKQIYNYIIYDMLMTNSFYLTQEK